MTKRKILRKIFWIVCSFLGIGMMTYSFLPGFLQKQFFLKKFHEAGLHLSILEGQNKFFEYAEGGRGETILCLHGFRGDKKSWIAYGKKLSPNYHVIAFDLPGHGGSSFPEDQHYDLDSLVRSVEEFVEEKGIKESFYLMGTSLGGALALKYAYLHPQQVKKLILVNPLGVNPEKNDFLQKCEMGKNILLPNTLEDLDLFSFYLTEKPLQLNFFWKRYVLKEMKKKNDFYQKAFLELTKSDSLEPILSKISTKTLLIAAGKDRILPTSSYEVFRKKMPFVRYRIFPSGTHILVDDCLEKALLEIEDFLNRP